MKEICFIEPPYHTFIEDLDAPFSLMYLAAVAEQCGWRAQILDMSTLNDKIPEADVYGVTSSSPQWPAAVKVSTRLAKEFPHSLKIVGGNHISAEPNDLYNTKFDLAILGEGEPSLTKTLNNYEQIQEFHRQHPFARDLSYVQDEHIKDLDSIPFPARHLVDWSRYKRGIYWGEKLLAPAVSIISSRGCPFNCIFCGSRVVFGRGTRFRSVENVVAEIKQVKGEMGYHGFNFHDDTFCLNRKRVLELCKAFEKLDVVWRCLSRVDTVDEEVLQAMEKAGCKELILGVECLSGETMIPLSTGDVAKIKNIHSETFGVDFKDMTVKRNSNMLVSKNNAVSLLEIRTAYNTIRCSKDHVFFTVDGERKAKELKIGDPVATIRKLPIEGKKQYGETLAEIFGYFVGDGNADKPRGKRRYLKKDETYSTYHSTHYRIRFSDKNLELLKYYKEKIDETFGVSSRIDKTKTRNRYVLTVHSKKLYTLLARNQALKSSRKREVPKFIMVASLKEVRAFLRGLYDAEGCVQVGKNINEIQLSSSSLKLIKQVKHLLIRVGVKTSNIVSTIYYKNGKRFVNHILRIRNRNMACAFLREVSFNHDKKRKKLIQISSKPVIKQRDDIIPIAPSFLRTLQKKHYLNRKEMQGIGYCYDVYLTGKCYPHRETLRKFINLLKKRGESSPELDSLSMLVKSNVSWERVRTIREVKAESKIYDLSTNLGNYVANGFVVHNSGSQKILDRLQKGTTVKQNLKAMKLTKDAGIQLKVGIIVGSPGETWETVEETKRLLKQYPPDFWNVSVFTPFPGTPVWKNPEKYGLKILTRDLRQYSMVGKDFKGSVVVETEEMSKEDIEQARDALIDLLLQIAPLAGFPELPA